MDFKVDYAFKYILGHKPVLLKLINDILPVEVSDIEYLPNEILVVSPKEKRSVFDVICTARHTGERFITEMQCVPDLDMDNRLLYYGCSLIHRQIERGAKTYDLKPVYVLCVANYDRGHVGNNTGQFFFDYQFREQSQPKDILSKNLQFFFLELPRLQKVWDKLETNAERWCYLFGNLNNFAEVPDNPAGFDAVFDLARTDELDGSDLKKYLTSMLDRYYVYSTTEYARRKGAEEERNKLIKSLLSLGTPVETLAKATGLTPEAIQALK
jgi:predicted transposase/invertase (TIGR01784 family)